MNVQQALIFFLICSHVLGAPKRKKPEEGFWAPQQVDMPEKAKAGKRLGEKLTGLYKKTNCQLKTYPSFFKMLMKQGWSLQTQSRRKRNTSLKKALKMKETKMQLEAWIGGWEGIILGQSFTGPKCPWKIQRKRWMISASNGFHSFYPMNGWVITCTSQEHGQKPCLKKALFMPENWHKLVTAGAFHMGPCFQ